ncbi:ArnT family glycosyltransferase [Halomarina oriensis]|uniref:Phospholipid carrier-dependent glycosyltransferase n=1 Tax=Halomarina oriensis TaxID=671145 RepID=A0A6B0GEF8_9EURY|nr:glycosyltransferase family 39 protein [Halomarina oriensis]MWG33326.1 phospholipid carrier-dependent glycosyltransferase [Halomarina oriensis]
MRVPSPVARVRRRVRADLDADPYLGYILLLTLLLGAFWFWHLAPNFATRDEMDRILDPLVAFGTVYADPSLDSLREGITWGRVPFGATLYLYALLLIPVVLGAALTGNLDLFEAFATPGRAASAFGTYEVWHATPEWVWWVAVSMVRLFNVAFAVGSVYLTYRIATTIRDRAAGRLAAVLLTFSWGFLTLAHEGGEDVPALFFVLLALYLLLGYVREGTDWRFYGASIAGGVAIAFKLTAFPVIVTIVAAYLLRAREADDPTAALFQPRLVVAGGLFGFGVIMLGFPTFVVAGFDPIVARIFEGSEARAGWATGPDAPIWWWFLRGYFSGLSLPLFAGAVAGVLAGLYQVVDDREESSAVLLVLVALATYVVMFSQWHDFRVHHLLPTFPLLMVLVALMLNRLLRETPRLGTAFTVFLLLTSGTYAVVGVGGYASMPRDEAVDWYAANADENDTVELYRVHMQDAAVPHWLDVNHPYEPRSEHVACPEYVEITYRDLLYLADGTYYRNGEAEKEYVRGMLDGEYGYEVVAEFGPRPPNFVPQRASPGSVVDLIPYGVVPHTDQYADEQELEPNQYTAILARNGSGTCDADREIPFY